MSHDRIFDLARFIHNERAIACEHVLAFLKNVERREPGLSFSDFVAAMLAADLLGREPGGRA
jgi:hypothetical protein